ncbi:probable apyrase 6 [Aristolochia californica]|uniref:probable apyrase 6 n=1 Tax=Aristolochia californica TaxID=171875 RepID=UPI0035DA42E8
MRRSNARSPGFDQRVNMDSSKLQSRSRALQFNLYPRFLSPFSKHGRKNMWIITSAAAVTISFFVLVYIVFGAFRPYVSQGYGIVIDGGSTGTRIHVFHFVEDNGKLVLDLKNGGWASMKVNPGLSSFSEDPESSRISLHELLEFAKRKISKNHWGETEVRLMATAGLRRLDAEVQERILKCCRSVLKSSGFRFKDDWASVIMGADEGIYAWVAANYALGTLGGDPLQTTGIIELGGASAQVAFVSSEPLPPEFLHTVKFGKVTYNLYSHSLLDFGQNVAYDSLRETILSRDLKLSTRSVSERVSKDPCIPRGYQSSVVPINQSTNANLQVTVHASGNFSECRSAALMLLQKGKDECTYQRCHIGSSFIPTLQGKFLATENFVYTSKFFGLPSTAFLSDLMLAGQKFCEQDRLYQRRKDKHLQEEDPMHYCFSSAYIVALLHDSLGVALNDDRIEFANEVGGIPIDWALGAFVLQRTANMGVAHPNRIVDIIRDESSTLLSLFVVSAILLFSVWSVSKWRKPQLKTIYDLEKGRYIVTRVNR